MTTALLDLNLLVALHWPAHEHHAAAHRWFGARGDARWATCPLTQLGFVGILSNPAFSRDALAPAAAVELLAQNMNHPGHEFWPDALRVPPALRSLGVEPAGHRQVTDTYLLALAARRKCRLATFDRGLRALAGARLDRAVEVVPTR